MNRKFNRFRAGLGLTSTAVAVRVVIVAEKLVPFRVRPELRWLLLPIFYPVRHLAQQRQNQGGHALKSSVQRIEFGTPHPRTNFASHLTKLMRFMPKQEKLRLWKMNVCRNTERKKLSSHSHTSVALAANEGTRMEAPLELGSRKKSPSEECLWRAVTICK